MSEDQTTEDNIDAIVSARRGRPAKPKDEHQSISGASASAAPAHIHASGAFPVKLARNYRPINDFTIDGAEPNEEQRAKVVKGTGIEIDRDEALSIISKGIAVRNDPI